MLDIVDRLKQYEPFFGVYRLDDPPVKLGEGASGYVYLIHDGEIDAALKVISLPKDQDQLNKLMSSYGSELSVNAILDKEYRYAAQEIEIMRQLKGLSNIVCFEQAEVHYRRDTYGYDVLIRMERLIELEKFQANAGKYGYNRSLDMALKIWSDLSTGLYYCERNGIVHLDIKPENIFYTGSGMNLFKLGDFGVSIRSENGKVAEGTRQGTIAYMSPEIYYGKGGDVRSDIYSLAIVIYQMLNNGLLPFVKIRNSEDDLYRASQHRLTAGVEIPPIKSIDPALSRILMRCLRFKPEERYQTIRELHAEIQQYISKPKPRKLLPLIVGLAAVGVLGAAAFFLMRPPAVDYRPLTIRGAQSTNGSEYRLSIDGTAGQDLTIEKTLNDETRSTLTIRLNDQGSWEDVIDWSGEPDGEYGIRTAYVKRPDMSASMMVALDKQAPDKPELAGALQPAHGQAQTINVRAESGSAVRLTEDGNPVEEKQADGGSVEFSHVFKAGSIYELTSTDQAQNVSVSYTFEVEQLILNPLALSVEDLDRQAVSAVSIANMEAAQLVISGGTAGQKLAVEMTLNGVPRDIPGARTDIVLDDAGDATLQVNWPELGEGTAYFEARYADYNDADAAALEIAVDTVAPDAPELASEPPIANNESQSFDVWTKPEHSVYLLQDGVVVQETYAELKNGLVQLEWSFMPGREYALQAVDAVGNESERVPLELRAAAVKDAVIDNSQLELTLVDELGEARSAVNENRGQFTLMVTNGAARRDVNVALTRDGEPLDIPGLTLPVELNADGRAELPVNWLALEDGLYSFNVWYADSDESKSVALEIAIDTSRPNTPELEANPPEADVEGYALKVRAEADSTVQLYEDDVLIAENKTDQSGDVAFEYTFKQDAKYGLLAVDEAGNRSNSSRNFWAVVYEPFEMALLDGEGQPITSVNLTNKQMAVVSIEGGTVTNRPWIEVEFTLSVNGRPVGNVWREELDKDGSARVRIDRFELPEDGECTLEARYSESQRAEAHALTFAVDLTRPELEIEKPYPRAETEGQRLTVRTEALSTVRLFADYEVIDEKTAGPDGSVVFERVFNEGVTYELVAIDAFDNESDFTSFEAIYYKALTLSLTDDQGTEIGTINRGRAGGASLMLVGGAPGQTVDMTMTRNGEKLSIPGGSSYVLDENGSATIPFDWASGADGAYTATAHYRENPDEQATIDFTLDLTAPEIPEITGEVPFAEVADATLTLAAEPGSDVVMLHAGETIRRTVPTDGRVSFDGPFEVDGTYTLKTVDAAGNESDEISFAPRVYRRFALSLTGGSDAEIPVINLDNQGGAALLLSDGTDAAPVEITLASDQASRADSVQRVIPQGDGNATIPVDWSALEDGAYDATACYQDAPALYSAHQAFVLDLHAPAAPTLKGDRPYADDPEGRIIVSAEAGSTVALHEDGEEILRVVADAAGEATLEYTFVPRKTYALSATDEAGNVSEKTTFKAKLSGADFDVELAGTDDSARLLVNQDNSARARLRVMNGVPEEPLYITIRQVLDGNGVVQDELIDEVSAALDAYGMADVDYDMSRLADGAYEILVAYAEDPDTAAEFELSVDMTAPEIDIVGDAPYLYAPDWHIEVRTEANCHVELTEDDVPVNWAVTEDDGPVEFIRTFYPDHRYTVQATDAAGNVRVEAIETRERHVVAEIDAVYESSPALVFRVDAEQAGFVLSRNGQEIDGAAVTQTGQDGRAVAYQWMPEEGAFAEGDVFTLKVTDVYGLSGVTEAAVAAAPWQKIALVVINERFESGEILSQTLDIQGSAEPGEAVRLLWNGEPVGEAITVDDYGEFSTWLDAASLGIGEEGAEGSLSAEYDTGFAKAMRADDVPIDWQPDDYIALEVGALTEDSEALVIDTDWDATIAIVKPDGSTETLGDTDGHLSWKPDTGVFLEGEHYGIRVADRAGNAEQAECTVGASERQFIIIQIANRFDWAASGLQPAYEADIVIDRVVSIEGEAEPNQQVALTWNGNALGVADVDERGHFRLSVENTDLANGATAIVVGAYADGRGAGRAGEAGLIWQPDDGVALASDDGLQLYYGGSMDVHTDPYAHVTLTTNGAQLDLGQADGEGDLTWTPEAAQLEAGDTYTVTVTDEFGHSKTSAAYTVARGETQPIRAEESEYAGESLEINGTASAGAKVIIDVNGASFEATASGEYVPGGNATGTFRTTVSAGEVGVESGDTVVIQAKYANGGQVYDLNEFVWDWKADLSVDAVSEDSDGIVAHAGEPVSAVLYDQSGKKIAEQSSDDGEIRWDFDDIYKAFTPARGKSGSVEVTDGTGNWSVQEFTIAKSAKRDITVEIDNTGGSETHSTIVIRGTAEPGEKLKAALKDEKGKAIWSGEPQARSDGTFDLAISESEVGSLPNEGIVCTAVVAYPNSWAPEALSDSVLWDCHGPALKGMPEQLLSDWSSISGYTEPGATVVLLVDGESAKEHSAGADGSFQFTRGEATGIVGNSFSNKTLGVMAMDSVGNVGELREYTFEERRTADLNIVNLKDGSVQDEIRIAGWCTDVEDVNRLSLNMVNQATEQISSVDGFKPVQMTPAQKAEYLGSDADNHPDSTCYVFELTFNAKSIPEGEYCLVLVDNVFRNTLELNRTEIFKLGKSAANSHSLAVSDDRRFIMNVDTVNREFPSDAIILTGWFCHPANEGTALISRVTIGNVVIGNADLEEVSASTDIGRLTSSAGNATYALVDRNIEAAADASVRRQLAENPVNANAGFVLNLGKLNLPDGEYKVTIELDVGNSLIDMKIANVSVRVNNSARAMTSSELQMMLNQWAPVLPTAAPAQ